MEISLFSQSLFALGLDEAIATTARIGFPAIELACKAPHLDRETARRDAERVAQSVRDAGLAVSALSLFNSFTDAGSLEREIAEAADYIEVAPLFGARIVKLTPGPPASADATEQHWALLAEALKALAPLARETGVRLAVETHMRQLTDTLASSLRFLELAPPDVAGLTVDFSNLAFAGEDVCGAVRALAPRMVHAHVKNGTLDAEGGWHFHPLDQGLTDYTEVLPLLAELGYGGTLSIECLGDDARRQPAETAGRDLAILRRWLDEVCP